jgi:hypothetical protein
MRDGEYLKRFTPPEYPTWTQEKQSEFMAGEARAIRKTRAVCSNELVTEDSAASEFVRVYASRDSVCQESTARFCRLKGAIV